MSFHLDKEIDSIKKELLLLGTLVEENVHLAVASVESSSEEKSQQVIQNDLRIDEIELKLEEDVLKAIALHQPVAVDLRYLVVVLKVTNELERIGDLAVNIADRALSLQKLNRSEMPYDITAISQLVCEMLKKSLDSLMNLEREKAIEVFTLDDKVDQLHSEIYDKVRKDIKQNPDHIDASLHDISISKHLERIGDHTETIAEDVVYLLDGEIIRHHRNEVL